MKVTIELDDNDFKKLKRSLNKLSEDPSFQSMIGTIFSMMPEIKSKFEPQKFRKSDLR